MSITVSIPTPLRHFVENHRSLELSARNVQEVLQLLVKDYPQLERHLVDEKGQLRNFVNLYLNDEDVRYLQGLDTPTADGDRLSIIPSIAGGSSRGNERQSSLTNEEIRRYSRHLIMPEVGMDGQKKLKDSSVICIGAGGLGSPSTMYLAAAGIGRLGLVDFDVVEESNLQRQIIHSNDTVGLSKLESARERLVGINPHIQIDSYPIRLDSQNALKLFSDYDLVIDGTDNFPTRYLVNDACVLTGTLNVYASIFRFEGQASVFASQQGPCYRCLYSEPPPPGLVPSCAEGGVLGILPGLLGVIQATEAIKLILGVGDPLIGRLLLVDSLAMEFREVKVRRDPKCPVCGENPSIHQLIDYEQFCGIQENPSPGNGIQEISVTELKSLVDARADFFLLDVRNEPETQICQIDGSSLIPLDQLTGRMHELDSSQEIVVYCRSGVRSARAIEQLQQAGFRKLKNLRGGILQWARTIDPSLPTY